MSSIWYGVRKLSTRSCSGAFAELPHNSQSMSFSRRVGSGSNLYAQRKSSIRSCRKSEPSTARAVFNPEEVFCIATVHNSQAILSSPSKTTESIALANVSSVGAREANTMFDCAIVARSLYELHIFSSIPSCSGKKGNQAHGSSHDFNWWNKRLQHGLVRGTDVCIHSS